jgi:hypothetical protein
MRMLKMTLLASGLLLIIIILALPACTSTTTQTVTNTQIVTSSQTQTISQAVTIIQAITTTQTSTITITTQIPATTMPPETTTTTTQLPTTTTPPVTTTTTATPPTMTADELASFGEILYDKECVTDMCHEKWDSGGKELFTADTLSYFGDADRLFNFTSNFMHGGESGTVLSDMEYLQIIAFFLVENNLIQPDDLLSESNLSTIALHQPPTTTARELANFGGPLYDSECAAIYCHEEWEDGGKEYHSADALVYFGNAEKLFNFVSNFMHGGEPFAKLSDMEYLQIIAFLLVENDLIQPDDLFGLSNLAGISLNQ